MMQPIAELYLNSLLNKAFNILLFILNFFNDKLLALNANTCYCVS